MSNILKGLLNEANPYRISEPEREYGAPFQSRPRMGPQEPEDVPDDLPPQDPFKQDPAKLAKVEYSKDEGEAPNGKRYNTVMSISGPSNAVRNEVEMFNKHHWGAKKIVDMKTIEAKTPNGPAQYTVYIVDNHKYGMWTPFKGEKPVGEPLVFKESQNGISASDLADILYNRLEMRYPDIVSRYGHEVVGDTIMDVADFHAGSEELGTSDVSIMIRQILKKLENYNVDESKEQDYGPEYQAMVNRVGQLAKQGERKTVYDPVKRVYKTVPVNPPKQQGMAEGSNDDNFTINDIHQLEQIKDFETLKARAKYLIKGKPARRMKPEKIAYFYDRVDTLTSPIKVIKMMYDLLLAGEGMKTIGSQNSTNPNAYQKRFTEEEQGVAEARTDKNLTEPTSYIQVKQLIDKMDKGGKNRIAKALRKNLGITTQDQLDEKWSQKYKSSINCSHPKGFSQKAHCAGKKKHNESIEMEMVCEDCGMCETHADHQNLDEACWKGYHKEGNKKMFGKTYPNCVKNEDIEEDNSRIARKPGQPANSKKHSDLYTDENPKGTITGLKFATAEDARASVSKIRNSSRSHAHKIQAAVAMEQRAKAAGKSEAASVYRKYINATKKTDEGMDLEEACWDTHKQVGMKNKGGKQVPNCVPKESVAEGKVINTYLWHGSRQKIPMLEPRQSVDTGGAAGSNQNAIYATSDPKVAIAVGGLTTPDSDTAMFPNDPQMVLFSGKIRKGENVYLHKLPFYGTDGKPQFVQGAHDREFYSMPGVKGIKPVEIKAVPVNKYLNLIRKATPADLKLRKKYMKQQGVAEGSDSNLSYQGNCTEDDVIEHIFGDVNNFANMVEEHGDEFTVGDLVVKYDPETDVHSFYYKKQGVAEEQHSCPHCGGEMVSEELMNEKKDACYYKVKSRYKVWPSAYASGALVKCRKKGAANWGNSTKNEDSMDQVDESLHDWFNKEKWVRMDTKGNIKGPCAREPGEGKPKCLPQSKAHSLGKKGRASAAQRKRREDPNPDRSGKAINVNTKKKSNEGVAEDSSNNIPTIGINVRSDGDIDYASLIVDGKKKYESRKTDSLRPYVGKTVGIVRTGNGPAVAIGQVTIGEPIVVDAEKFNRLRKQHLVPQGSKFDIDSDGTKYLYPMINPVRWDNEKPIKSKGIVSRKMQEQGVAEEFELAGVGVAYELGRKAYKQGMTIRDNPYSATKEARKYDEWEKGLERGKHDANDARQFRNSIKETKSNILKGLMG